MPLFIIIIAAVIIIINCTASSLLHRLALVTASRGYSFQLQRLSRWRLLVAERGSWSARALVAAARRLSGRGSWALLPWSMRNLPGPGIEPTSSALTSGFLSPGPPSKSCLILSYWWNIIHSLGSKDWDLPTQTPVSIQNKGKHAKSKEVIPFFSSLDSLRTSSFSLVR